MKIKNGNNIKYNYINEIINSDRNLKTIFALSDSSKRGDEFLIICIIKKDVLVKI